MNSCVNARRDITVRHEYLSLAYQCLAILDLVVQGECHPLGVLPFGGLLRTRSTAVLLFVDSIGVQEPCLHEARDQASAGRPWSESACAFGAGGYWCRLRRLSTCLRSIRARKALRRKERSVPSSELRVVSAVLCERCRRSVRCLAGTYVRADGECVGRRVPVCLWDGVDRWISAGCRLSA